MAFVRTLGRYRSKARRNRPGPPLAVTRQKRRGDPLLSMRLIPLRYQAGCRETGDVALELRANEEPSGGAAKVERRSHGRLIRNLRDAMGAPICQTLDDTSFVEIMPNPDGRLFVERLGQGMEKLSDLKTGAAEAIIGTVAHALQTQTDAYHPIISGELPIGGRKFEGLLPPVVSAPSFTTRRRAS